MTTDPQLIRELTKLSTQLVQLKKKVRILEMGAKQSQLVNSSLDNGAIQTVDANGVVRQIHGLQPDGTFTTADLNGDPSQAPSDPIIAPGIESVYVIWDGNMADGTAPLADYKHTQVHVSTEAGFTPDDTTLQGVMPTSGIFPVNNLTAGTTYYTALVGENTSGIPGDASTISDEVPINVATTITGQTIVSVTLESGTMLLYYGSPGPGNLFYSNGPVGGADEFGNPYQQGETFYSIQSTSTEPPSVWTQGNLPANPSGSTNLGPYTFLVDANTQGGETLLLAVTVNNTGITGGTIADSQANTWTLLSSEFALTPSVLVFVCENANQLAAGTDYFTVTFTGTANSLTNGINVIGIDCINATGIDASGAVATSGSGVTTASGTTGTLSQAQEMIVAFSVVNTTLQTVDAPFAQLAEENGHSAQYLVASYYMTAATTAVTAQFAVASSGPNWTMIIVPVVLGLSPVLTNIMTVYDTTGTTALFGVDGEGNVTSAGTVSGTDVNLNGQSMITDILPMFSTGVLSRGYIGSGSLPYPSTPVAFGTETNIFELDFVIPAGNGALVLLEDWNFQLSSVGRLQVFVRATTDGTTPVFASDIFMAAYLDVTQSNHLFITLPFMARAFQNTGTTDITFRAIVTLKTTNLAVGTPNPTVQIVNPSSGTFTNGSNAMSAFDTGQTVINNGVALNVSTGGGGGTGSPPQTLTKTLYPVGTYSYFGNNTQFNPNGSRQNGGRFWQGISGDASGNINGTQYAFIDYSNLTAFIPSGATVNWIKLTLTNQHSWYNSGMTISLGVNSKSWNHGEAPSNGYTFVGDYSINEGQTKTIKLPSSAVTALASGAALAIQVGPGNSSLAQYGYFAGFGSGSGPYITINYTTA